MWVSAPGFRSTNVLLPSSPVLLVPRVCCFLGDATQPRPSDSSVCLTTCLRSRSSAGGPCSGPLLASLPWELPTAAGAAEAAADPAGHPSLSASALGMAAVSRSAASSSSSRSSGSIARACAAHSSDLTEKKSEPQSVKGWDEEGRQGFGKDNSRGLQTAEAFAVVEMETADSMSEAKQQQQQSLLMSQIGEQEQGWGDSERLVSPEAMEERQAQLPIEAADSGNGDNGDVSAYKTGDGGVSDSALRSSSSSGSRSSRGVEKESEGVSRAWCPQAALASVVAREPRLAKAVEAFELKHPGSTIIFLAYSGSRLYGTNLSTSDVDIKGVYIPGINPGGKNNATTHRRLRLPYNFDQDFPLAKTFWYSSSDANARNTLDDVDVEMISTDSLLLKLLRAEVNVLETLFSMGRPHVTLLEDPEIIPLLLDARSSLVTKNVSSFLGYIKLHLKKFRKLYANVIDDDEQKRPSSDSSTSGESARSDGEHKAGQEVEATSTTMATTSTTVATNHKAAENQPTNQTMTSSLSPSPSSPSSVQAREGAKAMGEGQRGGAGAEEPVSQVADRDSADFAGDKDDVGASLAYEDYGRRSGKVLSHARRVLMEAEEVLSTGGITFPLAPKLVEEIVRLKTENGFQHSVAAAIRVKIRMLIPMARRSSLPSVLDRRKVVSLRDEILWVHHKRGLVGMKAKNSNSSSSGVEEDKIRETNIV